MKSTDEKVVDLIRKLHEQCSLLSYEMAKGGNPARVHKQSVTFVGTLTVVFQPTLSSTSTPSVDSDPAAHRGGSEPGAGL